MASAQAWNADIEDRGCLEKEIGAVRLPGTFKAYAVQPDSLSAEMAISRLGDLQDPERYSLIVGHDKQKILSVSPAMTGFTLTYTDPTDIGRILGGGSKIEFYWEDVKAIHCDEITAGTRRLYQFGLVANGLKKPFTVQCASEDELRHLVSALEFWIGAAGKGRQAPITGMPYLSQGLRLDEIGRVAVLWVGSSADRAGLKIGDVLWSLDTDAGQLKAKADLEAALETLPPGPHELYVVTPADLDKGRTAKNIRFYRPSSLKRRKMELVVP